MPTNNAWNSQDPAQVAKGGTGIATTTAYAPICGGTSATGAFQAATTGLGTSGYVLTSNGSSALPSFQAATGAAFVGFSAYLGTTAANTTGDGTAYFFIGDTANFNVGSHYNTTTGVFTAPSTGYYLLGYSITFLFTDASINVANILLRNNTTAIPGCRVELNPYPIISGGNHFLTISNSVAVSLSASDAVDLMIQGHNGSKDMSILGANSYGAQYASGTWGYKIG